MLADRVRIGSSRKKTISVEPIAWCRYNRATDVSDGYGTYIEFNLFEPSPNKPQHYAFLRFDLSEFPSSDKILKAHIVFTAKRYINSKSDYLTLGIYDYYSPGGIETWTNADKDFPGLSAYDISRTFSFFVRNINYQEYKIEITNTSIYMKDGNWSNLVFRNGEGREGPSDMYIKMSADVFPRIDFTLK